MNFVRLKVMEDERFPLGEKSIWDLGLRECVSIFS